LEAELKLLAVEIRCMKERESEVSKFFFKYYYNLVRCCVMFLFVETKNDVLCPRPCKNFSIIKSILHHYCNQSKHLKFTAQLKISYYCCLYKLRSLGTLCVLKLWTYKTSYKAIVLKSILLNQMIMQLKSLNFGNY
jgi:hypothetical protein